MSEIDNLPKADGKKEIKTSKNEDTTADLKTVIEDNTENFTKNVEKPKTIETVKEITEEIVEDTTVENEIEPKNAKNG